MVTYNLLDLMQIFLIHCINTRQKNYEQITNIAASSEFRNRLVSKLCIIILEDCGDCQAGSLALSL